MFKNWKKFSYADKKSHIKRAKIFALKAVFIIFVYILFTQVFFIMTVMGNSSMQPSINSGDRFVFSTFSFWKLSSVRSSQKSFPFKYGDIVMVNLENKKENFLVKTVDKLFRFFTVGKIGFPGKKDRIFIKRIIGLPGDEISMTNYVMMVRPSGNSHTVTEYELSGKQFYKINLPQDIPASWDKSIPFSGNMSKITLNEGECFVLSDDRSNTNDSRTWGPLSVYTITGKALLRYWPPNKIGIQ
ncbi:MAG: signal peptidase I [Spirochaetaceae bacterium]|jgi:signal peptidase I|nr:signal peptidase I [Spirochaetaceae bacterium]